MRARLHTRYVLVLLSLVASTSAFVGCTNEAQVVASAALEAKTKSFVVTLKSTPAPIPSNQHFVVEVEITSPSGAKIPDTVVVDADMPAHGHGMNTKPRLTPLGAGKWRAEGMLFHMPGAWELYVYIGKGQEMERAVFPVTL